MELPVLNSAYRSDPHVQIAVHYEDLGPLGQGAMGEVRRVRDRRLNRTMAMKILRAQWTGDVDAVARFVEEAQATAQLQHPGIVPVHEIGRLDDGRIYFTMKEVQGRTLAEMIERVHAGAQGEFSAMVDGWSLRRLIEAFRSVCDAVAYAHSRAVIHRDLKPHNIMVGAFGEVLVLDWGLALVIGRSAGPAAVSTQRSEDDAQATCIGTVSGTPAYMPPEQARGAIDQIDARSDVYALGAVLYQLLSGRAPYVGEAEAVVRQVMAGPPPSLRSGVTADGIDLPATIRQPALPMLTPLRPADGVAPASQLAMPIPEELIQICERAMARDPGMRYADAAAVANAIVAWLEGAQRLERARLRVQQAQAQLPEVVALEQQALQLRERAQQYLAAQPLWAEAALKEPGWELEDQAHALLASAETREDAIVQHLHTALLEAPDCQEAHLALAQLYRKRHAQAEARRDPVAPRYEALLRQHDRGEHARWLQGAGALTLVTEPAGASVQLFRYVERGRRRVPLAMGTLGFTPLVELPLDRGDWLLVIEHPACISVRYPVSIRRLQHWHGRAPGESVPRAIVLPARGALAERQVYVPAGWYQRGGDPAASGAGPCTEVWVEPFVVDRFATTHGEYQQFLDALCASQQFELAERCAPHEQRGGPVSASWQEQRLLLPAQAADVPIVNLDWYSAEAYARWRGGRLLSNDEWEKAARGVDARIHPWGDGFDPSFSRSRDSAAGVSSLVPVAAYPIDESPYGVRGLAGNACTWCQREVEERAPYRGGAWAFHEISVRSACRFATDPGYRYFGLGVRVARSWPG